MKCEVPKMLTIEEETEEESSEERPVRGHKLRESLSTVQPRERIRSVGNGWVEYATPSGRLYYCNSETEEKSWKPPRKFLTGVTENSQSRFILDENPELSRGRNSTELGCANFHEGKPTNVGKILRTGILKTALVEMNGEKVTKKWVRSFVVLTEFFILLTTIVGSFKKLFRKSKTYNPTRHYLLNAEVVKSTESLKRRNIYSLKTTSNEILFRSKKKTVAESWFHALTLVISNLKDKKFEDVNQFGLKERERTNSFDLGMVARKRESLPLGLKSASLSEFSFDETDMIRTKCLSDFYGSKYPTPPGWITIYDSETEQFCYMNCITKKKWFRGISADGHTYFFEEGGGRHSWLLPSIYLDVNSQILNDIRSSRSSLSPCNQIHSFL